MTPSLPTGYAGTCASSAMRRASARWNRPSNGGQALAGQEHLPPTLLRLSIGIEHPDDLWADLDQAIRKGHGLSRARFNRRLNPSLTWLLWGPHRDASMKPDEQGGMRLATANRSCRTASCARKGT